MHGSGTCGALIYLAVSLCAHTPVAAQSLPHVSVVIGNLLPSEGGTADVQPSVLNSPFGIDFDRRGNMLIVELEGGRVHELDAAGKLTTIAGDGSKSYRGDGGPAKNATFNGMHNVAATPHGDIYISDTWNHCVRKIDKSTSTISTIAGTGKAGYHGDGGPAAEAEFNYVMCISPSPTNDKLYLADLRNRRIRVVDLQRGSVELVAGNGEKGVPRDGAVATQSPLVDPRAVAVDSQGLVYILERSGHALRVVTPNGRIRTVAGTGERGDRDGPARQAQLNSPKHLCVDGDDNVIIADDQNGLIRKYSPTTQTVTSLLGRGQSEPPVRLSHPHGVCFESGSLYVVDTGNNRILRVEEARRESLRTPP